MGVSISWEKHEKMESLRREGRLCQMDTSNGGCSIRATVRVTQESWPIRKYEGRAEIHDMVFCKRHVRYVENGGTNFNVLNVEAF